MRQPILILGLALATSGAAQEARPFAPTEARPRLVLAISIDQLPYDYLVRFRPLFKSGL